MIAPSPQAIGAMLIAVTAFWFLASGRIQIEIVSLVLIAVLAVGAYFFPIEHDGSYTGLEIAFGGFGHEALIAICALMILGRGLVVTGALEPAGRLLTRLWKFTGRPKVSAFGKSRRSLVRRVLDHVQSSPGGLIGLE